LANTSYYPEDPWKRHTIDAALDFNGTDFRKKLMERNMAFFAQKFSSGFNQKIESQVIQADSQVVAAQ